MGGFSGTGGYNTTSVFASKTKGIRPVFTLKNTLKITGGKGTSDSPYTLGI